MISDTQNPETVSPVIRLRNVGRLLGDKAVWVDALNIPRGKIVAIIGASGSGKSTLLHLLGGLSQANFECDVDRFGRRMEKPRLNVEFLVDGTPVRHDLVTQVSFAFCQLTGLVFQNAYLLQSATASANMAVGAFAARQSISPEMLVRFASNLQIETSFLDEKSSIRSGGERQRIALARALVRSPHLVLADEPTANLDPRLAEETIRRLREWADPQLDRTVVWVTHDVGLAAKFADDIVVLVNRHLADWSTWPQPNPRDPAVLREWIDGRPAIANTEAPIQYACCLPKRGNENPFSGLPPTTSARVGERLRFWAKVGISQVFDGPEANQIGVLRRWTSVGDHSSPSRQAISSLVPGLFKAFGAKGLVFRVSLLIGLMVLLWAEFDGLRQGIKDSLLAPTLNPIVISSRATIDNPAINEAQRLLSMQHGEQREVPRAYGRYEFDHRRIAVLADEKEADCAVPQNRLDREIVLDIAALDPAEPVLARIPLEGSAQPDNRPVISDRFDNQWSVFLSRQALQKLVSTLKAPADLALLCMEIRGSWQTARIAAVMSDPARGRHGPYDIIMSATQWRDFGSSSDRSYYQSAAIYFDSDSKRSRRLVDLVRLRASEALDPPNTRIVQALANEAAFERIAAALERNLLFNIMIGFLSIVSLLMLMLVVYWFLSENFQNNLKSICVILSLGAGFWDISTVQVTRIGLVLLPATMVSGVIVLLFGAYQSGNVPADQLGVWTLSSLLQRYGLALTMYSAGILMLTLVVCRWWFWDIQRRSLIDRLKELD